MTRPFERQPGWVPCHHCAEYEAKVACRGCRYLVCGACALAECEAERAPDAAARAVESLRIDVAAGSLDCDGERARIADVLEVIVESGRPDRSGRRSEPGYEYAVRVVLGDRTRDFVPVRIRSKNPMRDLEVLVTSRGDEIARALGVKLRVERGG